MFAHRGSPPHINARARNDVAILPRKVNRPMSQIYVALRTTCGAADLERARTKSLLKVRTMSPDMSSTCRPFSLWKCIPVTFLEKKARRSGRECYCGR